MSKNTVIKIENLGKQYRLGEVGRNTIKDDLKHLANKLRGKQDLKLAHGESNDRETFGDSNLVWALKDISFDVDKGEVLGIIGKNGAGKSTLLKILSRVTSPSVGSIKAKGRIASLLEVGTGFHPDLTGRENIFLNGAILGMTKREIKNKFDEIVNFSGVARYIDTPVKRYSSGMYVRLAFAVAAHLDPDILVVDEVLAVGDAEFQKKCLGKMHESSTQGKTVLFVSHFIPSIKNLCNKCIYLEKGQIHSIGDTDAVIKNYLQGDASHDELFWDRTKDKINKTASDDYQVDSIKCKDKLGNIIKFFNISQEFFIEINFQVIKPGSGVGFSLVFSDTQGNCLFGSLNNNEPNYYSKKMESGSYTSLITIPGNLFNNIELSLNLICFSSQWTNSFVIENTIIINAVDDGILRADYNGNFGGFLRPKLKWETVKS